MLKQLTIAAFSLTAMAAFAGEDYWKDFNFDTASLGEKKAFVVKHAYKTLNANDAYTISSALESLPGNKASALINGLARNAWQAKMIKDEKQMAANMMPPMGDGQWTMDNSKWNAESSDNSRPMRMLSASPRGDLSYPEAFKILNSGNDLFDQGLVWTLFEPRSFVESQIPTVCNERLADALVHQIQANAVWTEPARLKYTSLAPKSW